MSVYEKFVYMKKDYKKNRKKLNNSYLNNLYYAYRRNNWIFDFKWFFKNYDKIKVDKPIFLLGTQGGGLTLVSRMLRRHKKVVSVTGDHEYWAGADEMQNVFWPILPPELSGIKHNFPSDDKLLPDRGWLYASDRFIQDYRNTHDDVTEELKEKFVKLLKWNLNRQSKNENGKRFIDKSQVFTVKVSFINELCRELDPKFLLVTRNPYAMCVRALKHDMYKIIKEKSGRNKALEVASQHWANSMKYALQDKQVVDNFLVVRFEDLLMETEKYLKIICDFVELDFKENMIPQSHHKYPFGSQRLSRWYPLRTDVNQKYLKDLNNADIEIIDRYCREYVDKFGYQKPWQFI
jgi:hypothetical protein